MTGHSGVDPQRLRAQLRRAAETIQPTPGYLERLRPRLRPARRRRGAATAVAVGLAAAIAATAVVVGPLVRDRQPVGQGPAPPDVPRTMVAAATEALPALDGEQLRDPARREQLLEQERRRRSVLLRLDSATGEVLSVLYRTQGRALTFALRDDGTAVVETGESNCGFELTVVAPDGRATQLGTVPGFEGNTGSSLASFELSPDGRLLAVSGTSCPDPKREGALHWRVAVYRVGARVEPKPLIGVTVPDPPDGTFPNPSEPSFSADGRHVAFPFETGQGSFDPARGLTGNVVTGFLDLDLAHPSAAPARRTIRPSGARCLVGHDHLLFGREASTLTAIEGCPGERRLVDVDRASGRTTPRLALPGQATYFASADFDAARTHLLLQQPPARRPQDPSSLFVWDGGGSLRHLVDLKNVELDGVTYVVAGPRW